MLDIHQFESHYECQVLRSDCFLDRQEQSPHMILHFDVNRTLIFSDSVQKQSPEDVIVNGLADRLEYQWDETLSQPINYTNYVKYYLYPNPEKSKEIKQKQKEQTTHFFHYLEESNHPLYPEAKRLYLRAEAALKSQKTLVFPSFYKFVAYLNLHQISHTFIFRTFGMDIIEVAAELNEQIREGFLNEFLKFHENSVSSKTEREIDFYHHIKNAKHHIAIQDDWNWWFKHGENYQYGKPFPIDLKDETICSLFFDDNASLNHERPNINIVAPLDISSGKPLTPEELINKNRLFPVDSLEALCDEDYFINLYLRSLVDHCVPTVAVETITKKHL